VDHRWQVVVASSDLERRRSVEGLLAGLDVDPISGSTMSECREILAHENIQLVFCDRSLSDGDYRDLLVAAARKSTKRNVRVVLMSAIVGAEDYQNAKLSGVFEVITTPCKKSDVEWMVIQAKRDDRNRTKSLARVSREFNDSAILGA
jgi:DNA-binding NtrC family response regulator